MNATIAQVNTKTTPICYHKDPLSLFQHLTQNKPHSLLLESAEIESKDHLKSIVMTDAAMMISCQASTLCFTALTENGASLLEPISTYFKQHDCQIEAATLTVTLQSDSHQLDEDSRLKAISPLDGLRVLLQQISINTPAEFADLFMAGVLSYDLIATAEKLPEVATGVNDCPDYLFYLAETLILIDHQQQQAQIVSQQFDQRQQTEQHLKQRVEQLSQQAQAQLTTPSLQTVTEEAHVNISDADFVNTVIQLKQHIYAGDIFQVVPSRTFSINCPNPLNAYRALKLTNPSPYLFYVNGPDFTLFGASPESALKYEAETNQVEVYPIAGTRPRGKHADGSIDNDLDSRIEVELRLDSKELAEHLMLVDLARNDIARISQSGSRQVAELLKVDRYSHVMHLVSRVTGQLRQDLDALHAYQACMNMGTLVGAPKIKAAELIRQVEQQRRGSYGGAVGYINAQGDMDTCIVIRSAYVKNGVAHIQAGAGVVFDSDPQSEADETRQKAQAVINAIKLGGGL